MAEGIGIAAEIKPPKSDPLGTVEKATSLGRSMLETKLLGNKVRSQVALGQSIAGATDPQTGQVDWNKVTGPIASSPDPGVAQSAPEVEKAVRERQLQSLNLSQEQVKTSLQKLGAVGDVALSLIADPKTPVTAEAVQAAVKSRLVDTGVLGPNDAPMIQSVLSRMGPDAGANRSLLMQLYTQTHATTEGLNTVYGSPQAIDTGGNVAVIRTPPGGGPPTLAGVVDKSLSPSEVNSPSYQYVDKDGVTHMVTKGAAAEAQATGKPPKSIVTSLPAGEAEAKTAAGQGAVRQAQALREQADKVPQVKSQLNNIRDALRDFQPGPKANLTYAIGAIAQQLGVAPPSVTTGVAAQEEFNKLATQFINAQVGQLGGTGTDSKLESARHGSPNDFMSREGIKNVTSLMLGLEDATAAKGNAWQKWLDDGNSPSSYGKFQTEFNKYYNPRVFQSQYMDQTQKQKMLQGMTAKERTQFQKDWIFAKKAGWLGE